MSRLAGLRALARVERRELRRHPARTLLVVLLVAVPVAAMVGGGALLAITRPTLEERRVNAMGAAELRVEGGELDALRALLQADARVEPLVAGPLELRAGGRGLRALGIAARLDGLAAGMLRVVEGRAPERAGELALSPVLLRGLGLAVGDALEADGAARVVTGVAVDPEELDRPLALLADGDAPASSRRAWLVDSPGPDAVARLGRAGLSFTPRAAISAGDGFEQLVSFVAGGFAFVVAGLVVAAAFAVGVRRRQRELGLLAATGASARHLRLALVASALGLAALGALLGTATGLGAAALLHPRLDAWNGRLNGGFELSPAHLAGGPLFALLAATLAVWLPVRGAARLPVRVALSGRRPPATAGRGWLGLGGALVVGGVALLALAPRVGQALLGPTILGGSLAVALGLGALAPWLLEALARAAGPLPLAWRLAVREAGRFRARNGPVVAAVLAAMSVSVLLAALDASVARLAAARAPSLRGDQLVVEGPGAQEVSRRVAAELGAWARAPLRAAVGSGGAVSAVRPDGSAGAVVTGGAELARALGAEAGLDALRAGRVLALGGPDAAGELELRLLDRSGRSYGELFALHVPRDEDSSGARYLIPAERLEGLGLQVGLENLHVGLEDPHELERWVVRLRAPVDEGSLERAAAAAAELPGTAVDAQLLRERPERGFLRGLLALCVTTGLVVVLIATSLSAAESAADAAVLHAVGAPPGLLRRQLAARAAHLALVGCALAVPAGLAPAVGLLELAHVPLGLALPWRELATAVAALPAAAWTLTWLAAALRPPPALRRRMD